MGATIAGALPGTTVGVPPDTMVARFAELYEGLARAKGLAD